MTRPIQTATPVVDPPVLERARLVSTLLDESITVPGTGYKVGLDPIVGVLPIAGDSVATGASLYIVFLGARLGLPPRALAKMLGFIAVDFVVGSVPILGTIVDAVLKVNKRNVATLERFVLEDQHGRRA